LLDAYILLESMVPNKMTRLWPAGFDPAGKWGQYFLIS
jgi:hypothetical protein